MEELKVLPQQKRYIPSIFGFNCGILGNMKHKPTIRQLFILKEIIRLSKWDNMEKFTSRGKEFVWINYKLLYTNLAWMNLSRSTVYRDILHLTSLNFIDMYEETFTKKSRMFFHVTKLTEEVMVYKTEKKLRGLVQK